MYQCVQQMQQILKYLRVSINYEQFYMFSVDCHMKMAASKLQNKRLVKYVNIKTGQRFLVHIIFKVSSTDMCICNYSTLFSEVTE